MADPLFIDRNGHRTWLKWHRARRKASDPAFTGARILQALRLGASVEVDLVVHRDHGFAILHDPVLDGETTGTGRVRETGADRLRQFRLRGNGGEPLDERVMLLEDLALLLGRSAPHPDALLQLDLKEDLAALDEETIAGFAASVAPFARHAILSGGDFDAITALAGTVPHLRTGYDPTPWDAAARPTDKTGYAAFIAKALARAPHAEMIYLAWEIVLGADRAGFDIVRAIHDAGRRIDAWTINAVTPTTLARVDRLLALKVDQITTDDPEGFAKALLS